LVFITDIINEFKKTRKKIDRLSTLHDIIQNPMIGLFLDSPAINKTFHLKTPKTDLQMTRFKVYRHLADASYNAQGLQIKSF